jgi:hypothetical protein
MTGKQMWKVPGDERCVTFADGMLYIRHADKVFVYDISL